MTYGQVRDQALQLLNQYSVAGENVAVSYNNQEDYLRRIPALVNDAMLEIATTVRRIPVLLTLSLDENSEAEFEPVGRVMRFTLPEDFYQFKTGDTLVTTEEGHIFHTNRYEIEGRKYLLIPAKEFERGRTYTVTYYRYPTLLGTQPADTDTLDNTAETHYAIPFYVAAFLVIHDDAFQFQAFYNKYEDKLAKMGPDVSAEVRGTADAYDFRVCDWYAI